MPATVNPPAQSRWVCLLLGRSESSGKRDVIDVHKTGNYPDFKRSFRQKCTAEYTAYQMATIKELFIWLRSGLS